MARDVQSLKDKVEDSIEEGDGPNISVFCDVDAFLDHNVGMSLEELCTVSEIPHGKVQLSTARRLEAAGFHLVLDTSGDQARTHFNVTVAEPVQESELSRFIECFDGTSGQPPRQEEAEMKPTKSVKVDFSRGLHGGLVRASQLRRLGAAAGWRCRHGLRPR